MFNSLLIFGIVAIAQSGANKPMLPLEHDLVSLITIKGEKCLKESGANPAIMHNILPWKLEESEVNGKFLLCLSKEMEFHDRNGHVKVDKFIDIFHETLKSQDVESYRQLLAHCNELHGKNAYYTVYKIANCFHTNTPVIMALHEHEY